jgi:ribA/ribD-fused uncharacterized protein
MRSTPTHTFFWYGPLSNWHRAEPFSGERAYKEAVSRLDALGVPRPSDDALSSRIIRAATFDCGEKFMMAMKAHHFDSRDEALNTDPGLDAKAIYHRIMTTPHPERMSALGQILRATEPREQKALGSAKGPIVGFDEELWGRARVACVVGGTIARMDANPKDREVLLATGNRRLVEGSPYDRIWGVGIKWDDPRIDDPSTWKGLNLLGQALEEARDVLAGR